MTKSIFLYAPKIIFDLLGDALYFLPWWYSRGLMDAGRRVAAFVRDKEQELAVVVWLKNIHKPLYDDYGWRKRVKSGILRTGQIILRFGILLFWALVAVAGLAFYTLLPVLTVWQIIYQLL